jgi:hypothetical protein
MTTIQLKRQIKKALDEVPEDVLPDVLNFLNELKLKPAEINLLEIFLKQTLIEDKGLLERLAQ